MNVRDKIVDQDQLCRQVRQWKDCGAEVVFTNGCFDILHLGHLEYLEQARALGDRLIIGVNSDASVRRLKGTSRPINPEQARAYLLASLAYVDLVAVFDEDTPLELITAVVPDVLVKGGDYSADDVVGAGVVRVHGGRVVILPYKEGYSTTAIEKKIISLSQSRKK